MASTDVAVVNGALRKIGVSPIGALSDSSKEAEIASDTWEDLRDAVLREHAWNFATERMNLNADATPPTWEFDRRYAFPDGTTPASRLYALRILKVNGEDDNTGSWRIENRFIVTNLGEGTADTKTFEDGDVTVATEIIDFGLDHSYLDMEGPFQLTSTGTLPAGLALATDYYIKTVPNEATQIQLSLTSNGAAVNITGAAGGGVHTLTPQKVSRPIEVQTIGQHVTFADWDGLFLECLTARLAAEWAEPLVANTGLQERMQRSYEQKIRLAKGVDGQEQTLDTWEDPSFLTSRFGS